MLNASFRTVSIEFFTQMVSHYPLSQCHLHHHYPSIQFSSGSKYFRISPICDPNLYCNMPLRARPLTLTSPHILLFQHSFSSHSKKFIINIFHLFSIPLPSSPSVYPRPIASAGVSYAALCLSRILL